MPILARSILKSFFQTGDFPTQSQFAALIDSLLHKTEDKYLLGLKLYNTLLVYEAGDSVIYNNAIYVANGTTGPGPFNPTFWDALSGTVPGAVNYRGTWDAFSNTPDLVNPVPPVAPVKQGDYFVVSAAGNTNLDGITDWEAGDWAIFNGTDWEKVDNTDMVTDGSNVGTGAGVFKIKNNTLLEFKSLTSANSSVVIDGTGTDVIDLRMNLDDASVSANSTWSSSKINSELILVDTEIQSLRGELTEVFESENSAEDTNSTTAYKVTLTVNVTPSAATEYYVEWYSEVTVDSGGLAIAARVQLDGSSVLADTVYTIASTDDYIAFSGIAKVMFTGPSHTVTLEFCNKTGDPYTSKMRRRFVTVRKKVSV